MSVHPEKMMMRASRLALLLIAIAASASPSGATEQAAAVNQCITRAAAGRRWLEITLLAIRKQEGGWVGAEVGNNDGSADLGPMQVNSWWVPRIAAMIDRSEYDVRRWLQYDPCFNVDAARWIFLSALHDTRDYWRAVGTYHSPTRWRQVRYARSVSAIMSSDAR